MSSPTNLVQQLPSYAYQQYSDDPNIVAFFTAYNELSQTNLDTINRLNLPNYLAQSTPLLDWVGASLYGEPRPYLTSGVSKIVGPINTYDFNEFEPNQLTRTFTGTSYAVSDIIYRSILQWNNFKGDGYQFTIRWLKRRVQRFLTGNIFPDETYNISVTFTSAIDVVISIPSSFSVAVILQAAVDSRVVLLPFQYNFSVTIV